MEIKPVGFEPDHRLPLANLERPAAAFPVETEYRQAYAPQPHARIAWTVGALLCSEVALDPPSALPPGATLADAAARMTAEGSRMVAVCDGARFLGIVCADALLECIGRGCEPARTLGALLPGPLAPAPTCTPKSTVLAAVDLMLTRYLTRLPVLDEGGHLLGFLSLATAIAAADRDPSVRDEFEAAATSSRLFVRPWS